MKRVIWLAMTLFAFLASSCNQKVFDDGITPRGCTLLKATYDPRWHLVYDGPDWEQVWEEEEYLMKYESLIPDEPTGLRAIVYHTNGFSDILNFEPYGGKLDVVQGTHTMLLYNNDTEYIVFNDLNKAVEASATTRARSRTSFHGSPYVRNEANENTINPPDMLYATDAGEFKAALPGDTLVLEHELRPLVYRYLVRYHFESGMQYAVLARGGLAGMAASVYLTDGHTSNSAATVLYDMDMADKKVTNAENGAGILYTVVNTFGAPGYPNEYYSRLDDTYGLNLELRLTNGEIHTLDFDITDQIKKQPRGGVINVYGINIEELKTPEDSEGEASSFDVGVEGWGEYQDIVIMK